ncbi:MAG: hypothetical protein ACJAS1_001788 [Oleiphilaceae bacterium]|jgi:hypothetical protein
MGKAVIDALQLVSKRMNTMLFTLFFLVIVISDSTSTVNDSA